MEWCPVHANNRQGYQNTDQFIMIVRVKYLKIICVLNDKCKFAQDKYYYWKHIWIIIFVYQLGSYEDQWHKHQHNIADYYMKNRSVPLFQSPKEGQD
jgi:hypothetical protein